MKNFILVGGNRILVNKSIESLYKVPKRKKVNLFLYAEKSRLKKKCEKSITFKKFLEDGKKNYKVSKNINYKIGDIKKKFTPKLKNVLFFSDCIWK